MKFILSLVFVVSFQIGFSQNAIKSDSLNSQKKNNEQSFEQQSAGFGAGLDYGGIGFHLTFYPHKNFGLWGAAGINFAGIGYNGGLKIRVTNESEPVVSPYILGMYGYNTVIRSGDTKVFYGPSAGIGCDFRPIKKNYFISLSVLYPFRSKEAQFYIDNYVKDTVFPVLFSVGYNVVIK